MRTKNKGEESKTRKNGEKTKECYKRESPRDFSFLFTPTSYKKRRTNGLPEKREREGCKRGPLQYSTAPLSGISFFSLASTERRFHLNKGPARPPSPSLGLYTDVGRWEQETLVLMRPWTTDWSECSRFAELRQTNKPFTYFPFGLLPMRGARK